MKASDIHSRLTGPDKEEIHDTMPLNFLQHELQDRLQEIPRELDQDYSHLTGIL